MAMAKFVASALSDVHNEYYIDNVKTIAHQSTVILLISTIGQGLHLISKTHIVSLDDHGLFY